MPGDGAYARLYLTVRQDEKFKGISDSPCAFGHYALLLLAAEAAYPEPPAIPRWADQSVLDDLAERGIIELVAGDCYTVCGLAAERDRRIEWARAAGKVRAEGAKREGGRFTSE